MKKKIKRNIVNYGLKVGLVLGLVGGIAAIPKELAAENKVLLVSVSLLIFAAQYIVADETVKVLFYE